MAPAEFDIAQLLAAQQQPNPAYDAAVQELARREAELHVAMRRLVIRFAPVACSCAREYNWAEPSPPQVGCIVHGTLAFGPDGLVLR